MRKRKKSKTGERTTPAQRKNAVLSYSELAARRKEDALALAELIYDVYSETEESDNNTGIEVAV